MKPHQYAQRTAFLQGAPVAFTFSIIIGGIAWLGFGTFSVKVEFIMWGISAFLGFMGIAMIWAAFREEPEEPEKIKEPWRDLPPTERQINLLQDRGQEIPETRGEASDLITRVIEENPATPAQKRRLRFYGLNENMTKDEAMDAITNFKTSENEEAYQKWKANGCRSLSATPPPLPRSTPPPLPPLPTPPHVPKSWAGGSVPLIFGGLALIVFLMLLKSCAVV